MNNYPRDLKYGAIRNFSRTLRHPITVLKDNHNHEWEISYKCRADVQDLLTNRYHLFENIDFCSAISKSYKIITVRYNPNITPDNRIEFRGNRYLILTIVNQDEADKVYQILASKI